MNDDFCLESYTYQLPEKLIAQTPANPRDSSRLMVVNSLNTYVHSFFYDLDKWLLPGDLLVLNNTRVIPARLYGCKTTGATVEILLLEAKQDNCWLALVKPGKRFKLGTEIIFEASDNKGLAAETLKAKVIDDDLATGGRILQFELPPNKSFWEVLEQFGRVPLPPYITSNTHQTDQYQTVYAQNPGAIAAPTAGLHFTDKLLRQLKERGIHQTYITLHVGVGTFRPVETENITDHAMHQEWVDLNAETVEKIVATKARGGRIIAVGTTVVRALEGAARVAIASDQSLGAFRGKTDLFIYPGYQWQVVDGLITNFHLPGSSLLMLVSALIGRKRLLNLYQEAIASNYRFYSFGDAMLILPTARIS
ncbi:MAG: tRNA preQ1(34) S-adenosylmethionine ribosyltransferase-isomerase QueA [Pleurocapsa sp.]